MNKGEVMKKFIFNFILKLSKKILSKKGGFIILDNEVISLTNREFYTWIYSTGFYLYIKEKTNKELLERISNEKLKNELHKVK